MPGRSVLVIQHEDACPPAWFGDWLTASGVALDVRRPYAGDPLPADLAGHDGLLVLGGSMGAGDDAQFGWLGPTRELVGIAARDEVPALGICLGHQLVAVALGGSVVVNPHGQQLGLVDLGWLPEAGSDPLFSRAGTPKRGAQWNSDVVAVLPEGAVPLARTGRGELQAARFAPTVWGVQLHPEADEHVIGPWADHDRALHPPGVVDDALAAIAAAHDELEASWRPLAEAFASLVSA
jgi:GMP synthase (glutamine-hydrolysing)